MKWFTATNEPSLKVPKFFELLKVALLSLKENTTLEPHLIYEGEECAELEWVREQGVKIVKTTLSFSTELRQFMDGDYSEEDIRCRAGAFLRTELAPTVRQAGINDEYVFYTDCDVIFLQDIDLTRLVPKYFAASGSKAGGRTRFRLGGYWHYNSGVMLINVDAMLGRYEDFKAFVIGNGLGIQRPAGRFMNKNLFMSDQVSLNLFYKGQISRLAKEYNWNPTFGYNPDAKIVHFNGLNWNQWRGFLAGTLTEKAMGKYAGLKEKAGPTYEKYVAIAEGLLEKCQ